MNDHTNLTYNSGQFTDERLVNIYNKVNPIKGYKDFYLNLAKQLSPKIIVDLGCGSGLLTCQLAKQGYQMIGIEPSNAMLDLAKVNKYGKNVKWIQGDATSLEKFNANLLIMTGHVAQFYLTEEEWNLALEGIYNTLQSGGYFVFESRNPAVQPWVNKDKHIDWPTKIASRKVRTEFGEVRWWLNILDTNNNFMHYEIYYLFVKSGEIISSENKLKFRTKEELSKSLISKGFIIENIYGDWNSSPFNPHESPEIIFIAKKGS